MFDADFGKISGRDNLMNKLANLAFCDSVKGSVAHSPQFCSSWTGGGKNWVGITLL